MKTRITLFAALLMMVFMVNAQPMRNFRMSRGMNVTRPDSFREVQHRRGMNPMNPQGFMQAIGLSDDQVKELKELHVQMHKIIKPLHNQLGEALAHQKTLMSADDPNMNAINDNLEKIGEIKIDMAKAKTKYLLEMRSKLTEEQRMKLEMMRSRHKNFGGKGMRNGQMSGGFDCPGMGF